MRDSSQAIVVIGMHRSGTSAVARGLAALGVDLGNDFLEAQPENPTGYWEDRRIVELNERVFKSLHLTWDDAARIDPGAFSGWRMWRLRRETIRYLRGYFTHRPLWGFKDPRTIRLLPFWRRVLKDAGAQDVYLLVIRNPSSIAASLFARQKMDVEAAQRLWLAYMVPFLRQIEGKPLATVDYDRLMADPRGQLGRIARRLEIPPAAAGEIDRFASEFLDQQLRHTIFSLDDIDASTDVGQLTRDAYALLDDLASDRREPDSKFWQAWRELALRQAQGDSGQAQGDAS